MSNFLSLIRFRIIQKAAQLLRNPDLSGNGERIDLDLRGNLVDYDTFDIYQKSHFKRYEFACSSLVPHMVVGDFACGTGYGTVMLARKCRKVIGADIDTKVVKRVMGRYRTIPNVEFVVCNLLDLPYESLFDVIISFETIEHFSQESISPLFDIFRRALKTGGRLIFSTPYMQEPSAAAMRMGFHLTYRINEGTVNDWANSAGFEIEMYKYQNYQTHAIQSQLEHKDFIICTARKIKE